MTRLLLLSLTILSSRAVGDEPRALFNGEVAARSFVDTSQIVSKYTTELYAHQCSMRIVDGIGYLAYQCNETTTNENAAGQIVRLAIFHLLNPTGTARWIDVACPGESSGEIAISGTFVASPMLHTVDDDTLRILFTSRQAGDSTPSHLVLHRDYHIDTGALSDLHKARCTVATTPDEVRDLDQASVQTHLDFLFGKGFGRQFDGGIATTCDMIEFDNALYSTIQIKHSSEGKTLLMTNVLMRSTDDGATWELFGAPDPHLLPGGSPEEVKILAEPALTHDAKNVYLHLRSNTTKHGYVLSRASKQNLYEFDQPVTKWTYGIGRPVIADFGKPIGIVAMFTAPSVTMGGTTTTRNRSDVVLIDSKYDTYRLAFSIVDYNAINTPFMHVYRDEVYVAHSTGRRRLTPRFGTSEIVISKLRREFFVPTP